MADMVYKFEEEVAAQSAVCSECGCDIKRGDACLVSKQDGVVKKRVCSEMCKSEFETDFAANVYLKSKRYKAERDRAGVNVCADCKKRKLVRPTLMAKDVNLDERKLRCFDCCVVGMNDLDDQFIAEDEEREERTI